MQYFFNTPNISNVSFWFLRFQTAATQFNITYRRFMPVLTIIHPVSNVRQKQIIQLELK